MESDYGLHAVGLSPEYDAPALLDYASGDLPQDRRHQLRVFGSFAFDSGLQIGGRLHYTAGRPINALGVHPTDESGALYGVFSFFTEGEPTPRGSQGRTDDVWGLDGMVKYDFQVGNLAMNVRLDVFHLFDDDVVTEVNEAAEINIGVLGEHLLNPDDKRATHFQPPRTVRLGLELRF